MRKKPLKRMKGQSFVFEAVLIFSISVAIFIAVYFVMTMYQNYYVSIAMNDQLFEVKELIASGIIKLAGKQEMNSSISIKIPQTIAGEPYEIIITPPGVLTVATERYSKSSNIYELAGGLQFPLEEKMIPSIRGEITIYKKANQIII